MVFALAGRRIDAAGAANATFPVENIGVVRNRLRALFEMHDGKALVSSAACGADLLALEEAGALGMRRRVILPFTAERFRATSVVDRPGDWGPVYDRVIGEVSAHHDLVVFESDLADDEAYAAANHAILDEAAMLSRESGNRAAAVLAWDGHSRGDTDLTAAFGRQARLRDMAVFDVTTL